MSAIDSFRENKEYNENLVDVLKHVLEQGLIEDDTAKGIAKKIVGEKSDEDLTDRQKFCFDKHVKHLIEVECDGHCSGKIDIADLMNAYLDGEYPGSMYCQHCMWDRNNRK